MTQEMSVAKSCKYCKNRNGYFCQTHRKETNDFMTCDKCVDKYKMVLSDDFPEGEHTIHGFRYIEIPKQLCGFIINIDGKDNCGFLTGTNGDNNESFAYVTKIPPIFCKDNLVPFTVTIEHEPPICVHDMIVESIMIRRSKEGESFLKAMTKRYEVNDENQIISEGIIEILFSEIRKNLIDSRIFVEELENDYKKYIDYAKN